MIARFEAEGMDSLFGSEAGRRRRLPSAMRRLIVDLKAEHPGFNPNEIARVCYVRFGRRPARKTVKRVLAEEPVPLRFVRRFPRYHDTPERRDGRAAVVALHADGWSAKAISGYLKVGPSSVYRILKRWAEEGPAGLEDRPHGRPPGVRKVTLRAMEAIRRFQENPHLGEFRIHAALAQDLRARPRPQPRALRTGDTEGPNKGEEGDALRGASQAPILERGRPLRGQRPRRRQGLRRPQRRLFALDSLGEGGWLKALKLRGYVARGPRRPPALQQALFAYAETP